MGWGRWFIFLVNVNLVFRTQPLSFGPPLPHLLLFFFLSFLMYPLPFLLLLLFLFVCGSTQTSVTSACRETQRKKQNKTRF